MKDIGLEILVIILLAICAGLFSAYEFKSYQLDKDNLLIHRYENQITQLEADAMKAQTELNDAWLTASDAVKAANAKSKEILNQKVPKDCNKAIKWMVAQAKTL